jgi:hypothetical protein
MVVIGDPQNPALLRGGFGAQFGAEDFFGSGFTRSASSREFNLIVDAGSAKSSAIHFVLVRLTDGVRVEGFAECAAGIRNCTTLPAEFATRERTTPVGRFDAFLHWDGTAGILSANWEVPSR